MKNYLIVTDTTSAMNGVQAKESGIELVSPYDITAKYWIFT